MNTVASTNHNVEMPKYLKEADLEAFEYEICNEIYCGEDADMELADQFVNKLKKDELFTYSSCYKKFTTKYIWEKYTNISHTIKQEVLVCKSSSYIKKHKYNITPLVKRCMLIPRNELFEAAVVLFPLLWFALAEKSIKSL